MADRPIVPRRSVPPTSYTSGCSNRHMHSFTMGESDCRNAGMNQYGSEAG